MQADGMSGTTDYRLALVHEMSAHNFDLIRFASYRTASKLRFIQKKVSLHALDIWNVIEAFREQGLHALEPSSELSVAKLETLLCSLYHSLNKRAPPTQQAHVDVCSSLLLNWLLAAYATVENVGKIRVFSIKVALATLCAGKLMDKLRYIFSQISDSNGLLLMWRYNEYLQEVLALPAAVYESPSFNYNDQLAPGIFNPNAKVTVNDFLDTMMSDPGPPPLVWLPLLHRLATVENIIHPIQCDACQKENFAGFRYRCQKCPHYNMCQECFWRGRVTAPHMLEHNVKEYSSYSPTRTIGHSLRKSFRCVPDKPKNNIPRFPEQPEKPLNLSHIVPPSPLPSHNGFPDGNNFSQHYDGMGSLDSRSTARSLDSARDDEHRLIARYAAKLAQEQRSGMRGGSLRKNSLSPDTGRVPSETCLGMDSTRAQRELIGQLEAKNREIMREIARLRRQQELESHGVENPALMHELRALRMRKDELETHLTTLQDSRRQLMIQLEGLMKMLKNHQSSPRSTPNSSPRSTKSPPLPSGHVITATQGGPRSAPQTPLGHPPGQPIGSNSQQNSTSNDRPHISAAMGGIGNTNSLDRSELRGGHHNNVDALTGVGGDVRNAFGGSGNLTGGGSNGNGTPGGPVGRSLRNDLLVAADSVTNAMSTLVRELNSVLDKNARTSAHISSNSQYTFSIKHPILEEHNLFNKVKKINTNYLQHNTANYNCCGLNDVLECCLRCDRLRCLNENLQKYYALAEDTTFHGRMMPYRKSMSDFEDDGDEESDGGWQQELQRRYAQEANFMAELRARQQATSPPEMPANCNFPKYPQHSQQQGYHQSNYTYQEYNGASSGGPGSRRSSDISQQQFHLNNSGQQGFCPFPSQVKDRRNSKEFSEYQNSSVDKLGSSDEPDHTESMNGPSKETLDWEEALKNWVNR